MKLIEIVASIPKSVFINFSQLQAIRLPIIVSWITKFKLLKGKMFINGKVKIGQIRIGISGSGFWTAIFKLTVIENNGRIIWNNGVRCGVSNMHCYL